LWKGSPAEGRIQRLWKPWWEKWVEWADPRKKEFGLSSSPARKPYIDDVLSHCKYQQESQEYHPELQEACLLFFKRSITPIVQSQGHSQIVKLKCLPPRYSSPYYTFVFTATLVTGVSYKSLSSYNKHIMALEGVRRSGPLTA
jgi:hypothetical protein